MLLLETLLEETFEIIHLIQNSVPRLFQFPQAHEMIKVAIGMRRSGKSYFVYQTIKHLLEQGISQTRILFINFEDDRLLPMNGKEMGELLDSFYTLYPENYNHLCYIFLDEIQNIPDWQQVIRRYHDKKNVQLFLTGSSAKLLSKEIATSLRGRSLSIEIWPYNFDEYLKANGVHIENSPFGKKKFDTMQKHLLDYFSKGGFPAIQQMSAYEWRATLQSYVDTVILRDIVERYNVSNISLLKYLINTMLTNAATPFSVNKFYNDIKSQGLKIAKETLYTYMDYIEDAYLAFSVSLYTESVRKRQTTPKKIYAIDNGLINAASLNTNQMYGKFLENQVYLDLRRQEKEIYFYTTQDGYEIDFITVDKQGQRDMIQVVWDIQDEKTLLREKRALEQAEKELGFSGRILTAYDYLKTVPLILSV